MVEAMQLHFVLLGIPSRRMTPRHNGGHGEDVRRGPLFLHIEDRTMTALFILVCLIGLVTIFPELVVGTLKIIGMTLLLFVMLALIAIVYIA